MRRFRTFAALAVSGPLLATAGCGLNPFTSPPPPPPAPAIVVPVVPAYVHGDLISDLPTSNVPLAGSLSSSSSPERITSTPVPAV